MRKKETFISSIIFFGAIWGILEATLGYLLHWTPQLISGNIMFPIGAAILSIAYKMCNRRLIIIGVGLVTAMIKSLNIFMPNISPFKVINPIISILIQTILFVIIIPYIINKDLRLKIIWIISTALVWRGTYVTIMAIQYYDSGYIQTYLNSYGKIANFIFLNGLIGGILAVLLISFIIYVWSKILKKSYAPKPLVSIIVALFAITFTLYG